jgi:tetratricopeptide (TPR) repeat protein
MVARVLLTVLLMLAAASPALALRVKLVSEPREFEAEITRLDGEQVTYQRGRREYTHKLSDFELSSAFAIQREFVGEDGSAWHDLARWALHRALYAEAREAAAQAVSHGRTDATATARLARELEADALLEQAMEAMEVLDAAAAARLLSRIADELAETAAAPVARALAESLPRVELQKRARELAEKARDAQAQADADEARRRKPIDDWLDNMKAQLTEHRGTKHSADQDCLAGQIPRGLGRYESLVKALETFERALQDNRALFTFRGQKEAADELQSGARSLIVDTYERWGHYLYRIQRYEMAVSVVRRGLALAPGDRRLLQLRVDLDDVYDPSQSR